MSKIAAAATGLLLVPACSGLIGGDDSGEGPTNEDLATLCEGAAPDVGHSPLRRLTILEYQNTVRDLLGHQGALPVELAADARTAGFAANNNSYASEHHLELYMDSAIALAQEAVTAGLSTLPEIDIDCDLVEAACMQTFIEQFGRRAFRRALSDEEIESYTGLFTGAAEEWGAETAHHLVMQAFLQSPHFLYLPELGRVAGPLVELSGHELASRLSYFLWKTMPDEELLALAESGALDDRAAVDAQVRRMLADERGQDTIESFHAQWLGIAELELASKDLERFPGWTPELAAALRAETLELAVRTIWHESGDASLRTLLTTPRSYVGEELAEFYGVTPDADGAIEHDPNERAGILTHASVMAGLAHADDPSWTFRGKFIREQVLCDTIPQPPDNVDMSVLNNPDRLTDSACSVCHLKMDPIGAGFDFYDADGSYRADPPALPEGPLTPFRVEPGNAPLGVEGEFSHPVELAAKIADSRATADCVASKWYVYAAHRAPEDQDACNVYRLQQSFATSDFNLRELVVAIATSESFRLHRTEPRTP
jgi:hypothetical protein